MDEPTRRSDIPTGTRIRQQTDDATLALVRLLEALTPEARTAFLLHDVFERGNAEIARTLGISDTDSSNLVVQARAYLRCNGPSVLLIDEVHQLTQGATMNQRIDYQKQSPAPSRKLLELSMLSKDSAIEESIRSLVAIRASQMNGCAFCVDMHVKQAKIHGERELRLHHLAIWRESTLFVPRERAALAWTEVLTKIPDQGVPDELYERVRSQLSEKELSDLTFEIMTINAWNRVNVAFRTVPGSADAAYGLLKADLS